MDTLSNDYSEIPVGCNYACLKLLKETYQNTEARKFVDSFFAAFDEIKSMERELKFTPEEISKYEGYFLMKDEELEKLRKKDRRLKKFMELGELYVTLNNNLGALEDIFHKE